MLDVTRIYNSLAADTVGAYGPGWSSIHELALSPMGDGVVWATLSDGAVVAFVAGAGENDYRVVGPRPLRLTAAPDGGWTLHEGHVKPWAFDADGVFTGGTAGAATLSVERDDAGRIVRVAEGRSGRSVTYGWNGDRVVAASTSDGRTATYTYDDAGVLVARRPPGRCDQLRGGGPPVIDVTDADGVRLAHNVYDRDGRVVEQTNEMGRTTRYEYSELGTTLVSDTVDGPRNAFTHDARGNLTALVDGLGAAMRLTYDEADRVTRVVDRTGAVTTHTFDDRGNLTSRTDADGLGQAWKWDERDRLVAETHRNGAVTTYAYDGDHRRPSLIVGPDGATISITVDPQTDLPLEIVDADGVRPPSPTTPTVSSSPAIDALGRRTSIRYDAAGLPIETVDASGGVTRLFNDGAGRVVESIIGDDVVRFAYTPAGRPLSGVDAVGQAWSATFGDHGRLDTFADGDGSAVAFEWDLFGNIDTVVAPDGGRFGHVYDQANQLVAAFDPDGNTSRRELDAEGRVIAVTDPAGRKWRRDLDVLGRTVVSIAPDGARTRYEYNPLGLVGRVVHPDGHAVAAEHDVAGRVTTIVDELGARYEYGYTPGGRLAERRWPSGRVERWTYDAAGHLASHDEDGVRTEYRTDGLGRLVAVDSGDGSVRIGRTPNGDLVEIDDPVASQQFEVDAAGRLTAAVDGTGVRSTYDWDARGHLTAATDPSGLASSIGYDARGRQSEMVTPGGDRFDFGFDAVGWIASFTDPTGTTTNRRDPSGRIVGIDRPGLPGVDVELDAVGRVAGIRSAGRLDRTYTYDQRGRLADAVRVAQDLRTTFAWDPVGRLDRVDGPSGSLVAERDVDGRLTGWTQDSVQVGIRRDDAGRPVGFDDEVLGPVTGPPRRPVERDRAGRIVSDGEGGTYRYDHAGRLAEALAPSGVRRAFRYGTRGLLSSELGPDGERSYRRGILGRVEAIVHPDWTETRFGYDARGRRIRAREPDGTVVRYRWDDTDRLIGLERVDPEGRVERHRFSIDALGRPAAVDDRPVLWDDLRTGRPLKVGATRDLHLDGRHRPTRPGADWIPPDADPWGTGGGDEPGVGFGSELSAFGLVWMGARVYDPRTREFLSPDPLLATPGRPGASSVYTYGFLDPVNFLDPSGLRPVSQEEWAATRTAQEQGRLGQAWEAIQHDPWGTLAMVGVAAVGVGLCFVPGGQAIGVGILIGVGTSAAAGIATGTFNPRGVAISGAFGAIPGGSTLRSAMLVGAASGVGADATTQLVTSGRIDPSSLGPSALLGAGGGALGHGINTHLGGARPTVDEPAVPALPPAPERLALPAAPERLALPPGRTPLAIEAGPQPLALPSGGAHATGPDFIVHPNGEIVAVPTGATGPTPVASGKGMQFTGGSGGHGLDARVTDIRVMDPVTGGKYPHPNGYVSYSNGAGQTVNPTTGQTVGRSDPSWHLDWSSP